MTARELGQELGELWQRGLDVDLIPLAKLAGLFVAFIVGYLALCQLWYYAGRWWRRRKR